MACHDLDHKLNFSPDVRKIVLAGNPNVGKSVFFNAFTGMYVDVSNYPGTTLEISHARVGNDLIIDTPGVYGVSSFNEEERVARDVILGADIVINVIDAVHLERDLFLTQQIIDMGIPMVIALNMIDEAARQGIQIDVDKLAKLLGVPVIPTIAVKRKGFEQIKQAVATARPGNKLEILEDMLSLVPKKVKNQAEAIIILEGDPYVAARNRVKPLNHQEEIYLARRSRVDEIVKLVLKENYSEAFFNIRLSRLMIQPLTGIPFLILILWMLYQFIGVFIAQTVVRITEGSIMQGYYEPFIINLVNTIISPTSIIGTLLVGEFGILTMPVTSVVGLLLPLVLGFYLCLSALEDSGYLPRIAVLVDRILMRIGLNGRGIIPIILGFGCVTAATITTRLLGSSRERLIATFLLALCIPCSAQLAIITSLLMGLGAKYTIMFVAIISSILVLAGTALNWLLPGKSDDLLIDLPPLRWPQPINVLRKTSNKAVNFIKEAFPLFAGGALLISFLQITGLLVTIQKLLEPITVGWLQLPKEVANAFIMGFIRRDLGATGLFNLSLSPAQTLVSLLTITIFVPCIASTLVIFKERSWREGIIIWTSILIIAFLIGGIVSHILI